MNRSAAMLLKKLPLFVLLIILTVGQNSISHAQTNTHTEFAKQVKEAEDAFNKGALENALDGFKKALELKPGDKATIARMDEIKKMISEAEKTKNLTFEDLILKGEEAFKAGDYPKSKRFFEQAVELDPSSKYSRDRLAAIRQKYTDPADVARFSEAMNRGEQELQNNQYDKARQWFEVALSVQPDSRAVKEKIAESDRRKAVAQANKAQYEKLVKDADALLKSEKRTEARVIYQQASELLPSEPVAHQRIQEIDNFLNAKKAQQDSFQKAIDEGDQYYINRNFTLAKLKYQEALKIKPDARYPKEMHGKAQQAESMASNDKERYDQTILTADALFKEGKLDEALNAYQSAQSIQPAEAYPQNRIKEIQALLQDKTNRRTAYEIAIKNGDQSLGEMKLETARSHYSNALTMLPDEKYPREKIDEINRLLDQQKANRTNYQKTISLADNFAKEKKYTEAISAYRDALTLLPGEAYPLQRINELTGLLDAMKQTESTYASLIAVADSLAKAEALAEALGNYQQASELKPAEKYPKERIRQITSTLETLKAGQEKYNSLISKGEKAYSEQNYTMALKHFEEAAATKPSEQYPVDKITAIRLILKDKQARQEMYVQALSTGDKLLSEKQYERALAAFNEARSIKPEENYPASKISEIGSLLSALKQTEDQYRQHIRVGDSASAAGNYTEALTSFQNARGLKPSESYPEEQISRIQGIIAEQQKSADAYKLELGLADKAFASGNYDDAITRYKQASSIKPGEKYPMEQLALIESILAENRKKEELYAGLIQRADQEFNEGAYDRSIQSYQEALKLKELEQYPKNRIREITALLAKAQELEDSYTAALTNADQLLKEQKYDASIAAYIQASSLKPEEKYPQEKILEIKSIQKAIAENQARDDAYTQKIYQADQLFDKKEYVNAIREYESALQIKPGESYASDQVALAKKAIAEVKERQERYERAIADADRNFTDKKYQEALLSYQEAKEAKPEESYPLTRISETERILNEIKTRDDNYARAIADGDHFFIQKKYREALEPYERASTIKPGEAYPKDQKLKINEALAEQKKRDDQYSQFIASAEDFLKEKKYTEAIEFFQKASETKSDESYPKERITGIHELLQKEKEELDRIYAGAIAEGDRYLQSLNYVDARRAFQKASGIKPAEQYPRDRILEINLVLEERAKALKTEYDKVIVDADRLYQQKILDQAIEAYEKAANIKDDEPYPLEMIRKIKQYIADHSILAVNTESVLIPAGDERKFSFKSLEPRLKNNNYVMLRAKAVGTAVPKVYFNYGRDNAKNGGIVLRTITTREGVDYLIRLAGQDKWYREDNNWVSLYTEGCDIEVSRIEISQGD